MKTTRVLAATGVLLACAEAGRADFVGFAMEPYEPQEWLENGLPCDLRVFRIYAVFTSPQDALLGVYGATDAPFELIAPNDVFHNDALVDSNGPPEDYTFLGYWDNQWDTYVTIGEDAQPDDISFTPGFDRETGNLAGSVMTTNAAWLADSPVPAGDDLRIMIAQLVIPDGYCVHGEAAVLVQPPASFPHASFGFATCCTYYFCFAPLELFGYGHYPIGRVELGSEPMVVSIAQPDCVSGVLTQLGGVSPSRGESSHSARLDFGAAGGLPSGSSFRIEAVSTPSTDHDEDDSPSITFAEVAGDASISTGFGALAVDDVVVRLFDGGEVVAGATFAGPGAIASGPIGANGERDVRVSHATTGWAGGEGLTFEVAFAPAPIALEGASPVTADRMLVVFRTPEPVPALWRIEYLAHQHDSFTILGVDAMPPDGVCLGDIDGSGVVDTNDLLGLLGSWGTDDPAHDLDADGVVAVGDLLVLVGSWGPCR